MLWNLMCMGFRRLMRNVKDIGVRSRGKRRDCDG